MNQYTVHLPPLPSTPLHSSAWGPQRTTLRSRILYERETYSIDLQQVYTVLHAKTLKWLPIVFVRLIQSQRAITATAKHGYEFAVCFQLIRQPLCEVRRV
jgi:hypothetical protein